MAGMKGGIVKEQEMAGGDTLSVLLLLQAALERGAGPPHSPATMRSVAAAGEAGT
jgi:hypothetical protein